MDELLIGAIAVVVISIIALGFLIAPCGNLRCYSQDCPDCETGETQLTKAVAGYKAGFGVEASEEDVTEWRSPVGKLFSTPGARLFFVLAPIILPLLLLLYFFFFTDAGHMLLGVGLSVIGILIMLISIFLPSLNRLLMPIGAIFFTMGVVMFTFS